MRVRTVEINEAMTDIQIERALYRSNADFTTNYKGHNIEFNKPDVRNSHNSYWWVVVDGTTLLKKATASTVLSALRNI
jgi:hypothetical protein